MGNFFSKIHALWTKFFGSAPSWVNHASMVLNFAAPLANGILAALDPADAVEAEAITTEIKKGLTVAASLLTEANGPANIPTIKSAINSVNDNLAALLAAGHIKDPATLAKVTAISNTITGELNAVLGILPQ